MAPDKRGRKESRPSQYPKGYPKGWTDWGWDNTRNCNYRAREIAKDQYEYEYDKQASSPSALRGNAGAGDHTPGSPEYSMDNEYTTTKDPVAGLTEDLADTSLNKSSMNIPPPTAILKTKHPNTLEEKFDPHYKVHREKDFWYGRVFKVLWSEPEGSGGTGGGTEMSYRKKHGEEIHAKVRRFIIIKPGRGHCICLPIMTYMGRGTTKNGVHIDDHSIIYTDQPILLEGESEMKNAPIRVIPDSPRHRLHEASRLNYAKVYTVECNVKVWFIGRIHTDSEWSLAAAYNLKHPPLELRGKPPANTFGYAPNTSNISQNTALSYPGNYTPAPFHQTPVVHSANPAAWQGSVPTTYAVLPGASATSWTPQQPYSATSTYSNPGYTAEGYHGQQQHAHADTLAPLPESQETQENIYDAD